MEVKSKLAVRPCVLTLRSMGLLGSTTHTLGLPVMMKHDCVLRRAAAVRKGAMAVGTWPGLRAGQWLQQLLN